MLKIFNKETLVVKYIQRYAITLSIIFIMILCIPLSYVELIEVNISEDQIRTLIGTVIGSLSSIFGIIIAVLILAFSMFEKNFGKLAYKKFMKNTMLSNYIQLVIMDIVIFLEINFLLSSEVTSYCLNITILGLIIYIVSLILIFPIIKELINDSTSETHVKEIMDKINFDSANEYFNASQTEELMSNPFYELTNLTIKLIDNNERLVIINIINKTSELLRSLYTDYSDNQIRESIQPFISLYQGMNSKAMKTGAFWVSQSIINQYYSIKIKAIADKKTKFTFVEYDGFIDYLILEMLDNRKNIVVDTHIRFLFHYIKLNIEGYLPNEMDTITLMGTESELSNKDYSNQYQWDLISTDVPFRISEVTKNIVNRQQLNLNYTIAFEYTNLFDYIIKSSLLSYKQKRVLLNSSSIYFFDYLTSLAKAGQKSLINTYISFQFLDFLEFDEQVFMNFYISYEKLFIELYNTNQLDNFQLNEFATIGRMISKEAETKESVKNVLVRMVTLLIKLGMRYIKSLRNDDLILYKEIYGQVQSIIHRIEKSCPDSDIYSELTNMFNNLDNEESVDMIIDDLEMYYDSLLYKL